jgi:ribosomal-protein-alanine N-acetyltransferase
MSGSGLGVLQSHHQGDHLPGVTGDRGLLEADDAPAAEDLPQQRLGEVVAGPLRVQAGAQQEASTRAQHALDLAGVAGAVGGRQVVEAAAVQHDVETGLAKRQLQDVGLDEPRGRVEVVGALQGGEGAVDADGERHAALGEVGELGAQPAAKVQGALGVPEPAVIQRRQQLGWGRGGMPDPVDVGLVVLVEDAWGLVHERESAAGWLACPRRAGTVRMQDRDELHWPKDVPGLSTARLWLRAVDPAGDAAAMLRLLGDPEVTRFSNAPRCTTLAQAQAALELFPQRFAAREMIRWAIQPLGHGEAIGTVGLLRVNHEHRRGELGYELARRWWGKGLAAEAAAAAVTYGFVVMGLHRIEAGVLVGNDASVRVLERLGFCEEGTLRDYLRLRGGFHSCRFFSLLATDARRSR